jgi:hypothetical protein
MTEWSKTAVKAELSRLRRQMRKLDKELRPVRERAYKLVRHRDGLLRCVSRCRQELACRERADNAQSL